MAAPKKKSIVKDIAKEIHAQLADTVQQLVTSDGWAKLLVSLAEKNGTEIGRYSFGNMLLILVQCPEATAVCSFKAWKERGRSVVKGAKSIRINAPMSVTEKDAKGQPVLDKNGNEKKRTLFKLIPVFDVSQTEPIWQNAGSDHTLTITPTVSRPKSIGKVKGAAPAHMWGALEQQITALGYTVKRGNTGHANGVSIPANKTVIVSDTLDDAHAHKTLAHELGHLLFDHVADLSEYQTHQGRMETEAESFAFMVCSYYGLDSAAYSAPYIGSWAGKDPEKVMKTVQATGDAVLKAFRAFLAVVEAPSEEKVPEVPAERGQRELVL